MDVREPLLNLDPTNGRPLYLQLQELLQRRIEEGEWPPGTQLPTENQLCDMYQVSRITVRQALSRMADLGLVARERARGTFVRDTQLTAGARGVSSFTAELAEMGMVAGSRLLDRTLAEPSEPARAALQLEPAEQVVAIKRLRTGSELPIGLQLSQLPAVRFGSLVTGELIEGSLYQTLHVRYGVTPIEALETFTVGGVGADDAEILGVAPGSPAFFVERTTFDSRGPFEYATSIMRGDRYRLRLALRNP